MSLSWKEHSNLAESLVREAVQDAASAPNTDALIRALITVQTAQVHATLALAGVTAR